MTKDKIRNGFERADCAVRAVAVATGEDYGRCLMYFAACGRKPRRRTKEKVTKAAVRRLGYKMEPWPVDGKTVRTVERELPDKGGFILWNSSHLIGYKDGKVIDWSEGKMLRVHEVFRITAVNQ
jgi:hypothetical protein